MLLGKIVGTAVSTIKIPELAGVKLLIVQPLGKNQEPVGTPQVAADATQAGAGYSWPWPWPCLQKHC
jgi:ethanolamine utilization protein EutN